jgi:large subunit ribosomal protein L30
VTHLRLTLRHSTIGCTPEQRLHIRGLGLRKIGQVRELENTPAVRGMVKRVLHLVDVEEIAEAKKPRAKKTTTTKKPKAATKRKE